MFRRVCWLAVAALVSCRGAETECAPYAPCYAGTSIASIASGTPGALAPNTLVSIYGTNLSFVEKAVSIEDIQAGELPRVLPGTGVYVFVGGVPGQIYYVSPGQVNLLVPSNLRAAEVTIQLVREGTAGPALRLKLREAAPALFRLNREYALVSTLDYSLVTPGAPAHPDEWVVLWATGLGPVSPPADYGRLPSRAASLQKMDDFQVYLDGVAVNPERIAYAGVAVGYAGLYQVNLKLPVNVGDDPEVRIVAGEEISPPALRLAVRRTAP